MNQCGSVFFSSPEIEVNMIDIENMAFTVNKEEDIAKPLENFMEM